MNRPRTATTAEAGVASDLLNVSTASAPIRFFRSPVLFVVVLSSVSFLSGIRAEFLADDRFLIFQRLDPQNGVSSLDFFRQDYWMGVGETGLYRPVGLLFVLAERELFGTWVVGYHGVSLLLHVLACVLLWRVFRRLLGERAAAVGTLLFSCHPIHAEAVLPVYGQLDLIVTVLLAVSILSRWHGRHLLGVASLGLAMLSKESAMIGPLLMLWLDRADIQTATASAESGYRPGEWLGPGNRLRRAAVFPYWSVLMVVVSLRISVLGSVALSREATVLGNGGMVMWLKSVVVAIGHAIRLCVWPTGQTVYYGHLRDSLLGTPMSELLWIGAGITTAALVARWAPKAPARVAIGWFVVCLLPVSNLAPIGVLVAERALYLPSAGITALAGLCWVKLEEESRERRLFGGVYGALAAALILSCFASAHTAWRWRSELSLWSSTVADHPRSPKAQAMLGLALLRDAEQGRGDIEGLLRQADICFGEALRLNPRSVDGLYGRGLIRSRQGTCQEALPYFLDAAALRPFDEGIQMALKRCQDSRQAQ